MKGCAASFAHHNKRSVVAPPPCRRVLSICRNSPLPDTPIQCPADAAAAAALGRESGGGSSSRVVVVVGVSQEEKEREPWNV